VTCNVLNKATAIHRDPPFVDSNKASDDWRSANFVTQNTAIKLADWHKPNNNILTGSLIDIILYGRCIFDISKIYRVPHKLIMICQIALIISNLTSQLRWSRCEFLRRWHSCKFLTFLEQDSTNFSVTAKTEEFAVPSNEATFAWLHIRGRPFSMLQCECANRQPPQCRMEDLRSRTALMPWEYHRNEQSQ